MEEQQYTFYGHETVGAEIADTVLRRLGILAKPDREEVVWLVQNHMKVVSDMGRGKQAKVLRKGASSQKLLALQEADIRGRWPLQGHEITAMHEAAEKFYSNDKVLTDLGITGKLLLTLRNKHGAIQKPGPELGAKLDSMTTRLDKDPTLARAELLKSVGLYESEN